MLSSCYCSKTNLYSNVVLKRVTRWKKLNLKNNHQISSFIFIDVFFLTHSVFKNDAGKYEKWKRGGENHRSPQCLSLSLTHTRTHTHFLSLSLSLPHSILLLENESKNALGSSDSFSFCQIISNIFTGWFKTVITHNNFTEWFEKRFKFTVCLC